ncbi:uncharacterized protein B0H18DRAFT_951323 [Fomitopsis serialis]|uniref:uncharacterized protein n=1 Tax=Fomitopsis serialis TaxID=139415 RepID=UPI002007D6CF|nr:uncharacterized protein B0H18DRAFT_951323 [Neoantrodia serialis]KAH9934757.1 hypothetical protein B0H18DRAFT_951323 [Neoantrodia serialis]
MSNDVLIDMGDMNSLNSASSDDADAVNTESAKIYFGPLQSPEQKFASTSRLKTPVRKSTRLSSARAREHTHVNERVHQSTPTKLAERAGSSSEEDMLQDEPSLVLANKVLHAHDNPSPPPSPSPNGEAHLPNPDILIDLTQADEPMPMLASDADSPSPARQVGDGEANTSLPDLINFDSFSTPSVTPRIGTPDFRTSTEATSPLSRRSIATTVDDLLSLSPPSVPIGPQSNQEDTLSALDALTPTAEDEEQVLHTLIDHAPAVDAPSSKPEERVPTEARALDVPTTDAPATVPEVIEPSPVPQPHTPARRSSRKRSSISPARPRPITEPTTLLGVPTPHQAGSSSTLASPAPALVFPPLGVRVKKKGSSRDVSPNVGGSSVNPVDITQLVDEKRPVSPGREARRNMETQQRRRLGSLSPTSTGLLMQLMPNGSSLSTGDQATAVQTTASIVPNGMHQPTPTSLDPSQPLSTPQPSGQATEPQSITDIPPATPIATTEPSRSPARRIPIHEAIAQGTFSPSKQSTLTGGIAKAGSSVGLLGTPVFRRPRQALDDPNRSPAKRVPLSQAFAPSTVPSPEKGKAPMRPSSPVRPSLKERARSNSVEPVSRPLFEQSRSAEPTRPSASSLARPFSGGSSPPRTNAATPLPYPLVPSSSRVHPPIPEVDEGEEENRATQQERVRSRSPPGPSPVKNVSALRQSSASSRIPRIGAKPYARPKPKEPSPTLVQESKPPIVPRRALGAAGGATRPFKALQGGQGSSSSSDGSSPRYGTPGSTAKAHAIPQQPPAAEGSRVSALKRKRDGEKSLASPPGAKPVVVIRKVVPGMFGQSSKAGTSAAPPAGTPAAEPTPYPSPQKPRGPIRMRKVADWKPPPREPKPARVNAAPAVVDEPAVSPPPVAEHTSPKVISSPPPMSSSPQAASPTVPPASHAPAAPQPPPLSPPVYSAETESETRSNGTRRSSRSRRTVANPTTDVFGVVNAAPVRPLNVRRKRPLLSDTSAFAGMTAMALRALTSSNTQKNQQQVVSLKTEVIHKEGKRPGSPTTKVRTILEKQREIKAQQRHERAERRARRSSEGVDASESQADMSVDLGDVSTITLNDDGIPARHRRGPGDEEDYVTPPRPERPPKREKLDHEVKVKDDKRVKWDRGLATSVYLDEISSKPKKPASSEAAKKGCLAPTAKTLRLDTLGNVLDAGAPLINIVREDVVVKKFVYDDDEDAKSEVPEAEPVAPLEIKPKSKSKKNKP